MELAAALRSLIVEEGVPLFGIADAVGFQKALPDWHPLRLMPAAKRALIFGRPFVSPRLVVDEKTDLSNDAYWKANEPVLAGISRLRGGILNLLDTFGFAAGNFGGFNADFTPTFSCSRCAEVCPAKAIDPETDPETCYDREKCIRYIRALKRKYGMEAKALLEMLLRLSLERKAMKIGQVSRLS